MLNNGFFVCFKHVFNTCEQVPCVLEVISYREELHTLYIVYSYNNKGSNCKHVKSSRHDIISCRKVCMCELVQYDEIRRRKCFIIQNIECDKLLLSIYIVHLFDLILICISKMNIYMRYENIDKTEQFS